MTPPYAYPLASLLVLGGFAYFNYTFIYKNLIYPMHEVRKIEIDMYENFSSQCLNEFYEDISKSRQIYTSLHSDDMIILQKKKWEQTGTWEQCYDR